MILASQADRIQKHYWPVDSKIGERRAKGLSYLPFMSRTGVFCVAVSKGVEYD